MSAVVVRPEGLRVGDFLASDLSIYVEEIYRDDDGVWVEWSDGDCGYLTVALRVVREFSV